MKVRKITKNDLISCSKILEDAYRGEPYNEVFKYSTAREYVSEKYKNYGKNSFVVTNQDNVVIAFIFLNISSWSNGLQAILEEIVVSPSFQETGVGKELISHAHDYLNSLGVKSIILWAKKDERLLNFYQKNGYFLADDFVVMFKNL